MIKVELNNDDIKLIMGMVRVWQDDARKNSRDARAPWAGSIYTDTLGAYGEVALAKHLKVPIPLDHSYKADINRGYDVAGYQVKCSGTPPFDLPIYHTNPPGRYVLCIKPNTKPIVYIAGWIHLDQINYNIPHSHVVTTIPNSGPVIFIPRKYLLDSSTLRLHE